MIAQSRIVRNVSIAAFGMLGLVMTVTMTASSAHAENGVDVTYYKDVLPIIQENCQSCHRPAGLNISGLVAPMSFMTFEDTRPWARSIARKVESREMPPWFASAPKGVFENERGLADHEIATILNWVDAGAPGGSHADAPPARVFAEEVNDGWSHGEPDLVFTVNEPFVVPDDTYDINKAFHVQLTEDLLPENVWVRGWELRTGAAGSGVHHMCLFERSEDVAYIPNDATPSEAAVPLGGLLSCVAEGAESGMLPDGYGFELKTGSTLEFNMHFNKEPGPGTSFETQAEVGFFVENRPVKYKVRNDSLANNGFEIPPNHPNYRIGMSRTLKKDTLVINYWPHAHFRAIAARYTAYYPDGREELLLDVPNYDQSWQVVYKYKEPKFMPKGTRIEADFWYDNTAERGARRRFDADRALGFGDRTNDEMALGFISYAEVDDDSTTSNQQD